jgi:hypothetical protein
MAVSDGGNVVKVRMGDRSVSLSYADTLRLAQELERWLQRSADENASVWAAPLPGRKSV